MSKAILVMDMPDSCDKCPLFCNYYSDMCCSGLNNKTINYPYPEKFRQEWCPLKDIPEKLKSTNSLDEYEDGFVAGWNNFIEENLEK